MWSGAAQRYYRVATLAWTKQLNSSFDFVFSLLVWFWLVFYTKFNHYIFNLFPEYFFNSKRKFSKIPPSGKIRSGAAQRYCRVAPLTVWHCTVIQSSCLLGKIESWTGWWGGVVVVVQLITLSTLTTVELNNIKVAVRLWQLIFFYLIVTLCINHTIYKMWDSN